MLTQDELKEVLNYDPETGIFTWKLKRRGSAKQGSIAGYLKPDGYRIISVCGINYSAHRLAFLYMEGYIPEYCVDHINGVSSDNKWKNLRHATASCNLQNAKLYSSNFSGFVGVSFQTQTNKWRAAISLLEKRIYLGSYPSPLEAALARLTFEIQCPLWSCNARSELVKAIKKVWPEFNLMLSSEQKGGLI